MAEGFETREVTTGPSPSGLANQPARQLGQVGVVQPRGGNVSNVGKNWEALASVAKDANQVWNQYRDDKRVKDEVELEMLYQQGKTESEARAAGYNSKLTKKVYQTMNLNTGFQEWQTQESHDAVKVHPHLTPEEYRTQVFNPKFEEVLQGLDPSDHTARELYTSMAKQASAKIVQRHSAAHADYVHKQTENSLYGMLTATASGVDPDATVDLVGSLDTWGSELGKDSVNMVTKSAVVDTLLDDNLHLFDALGGTAGLKKRGLSPDELKSVDRALDTALRKRRVTTATQRIDEEEGLMASYSDGQLSLEETIAKFEGIQEKYRLDEGYVDQFTEMAVKQSLEDRAYDKKIEQLSNPEARREMNALVAEVSVNGMTEGTESKIEALGKKYDLDRGQSKDLLQRAVKAQDSFEKNRINEVKKIVGKRESEVRKRNKAKAMAQLRPSERLAYNLTAEEEQYTLDEARELHATKAARNWDILDAKNKALPVGEQQPMQDKDAYVQHNMAKAFANEIKFSTVVDKNTKEVFEIAGQMEDPLDRDGNIQPEIQEALIYYQELVDVGVKSSKLKEYAGEDQALFDLLVRSNAVSNGEINTSLVDKAYRSRDYEGESKANVQDVMKDWKGDLESMDFSQKGWFYHKIEKNIFQSAFNSPASSDFNEVLTHEVDRVREDRRLDMHYQRTVQDLIKLNTWASNKQIRKMADAAVERDVHFMAGNLVLPHKGKTIIDDMGIAGIEGEQVANKAFMVGMLTHVIPNLEKYGIPEESIDQGFMDWAARKTEDLKRTGDIKFSPQFPVLNEGWQEEYINYQYTDIERLNDGFLNIYMFEGKDRDRLRGKVRVHASVFGDAFKQYLNAEADKQYNADPIFDTINKASSTVVETLGGLASKTFDPLGKPQ